MYYLIVNPISGGGAALKMAEQATALLKDRKIPFTILYTERPGHAADLAGDAARKTDCSAIIAVGGDGLAYEVCCGIAGTKVPMGIIPGGTGNDFVKSTGTPKDVVSFIDFIEQNEPKSTDFGSMNNGHFLNVCGTGFDVTVLEQTTSFKKYFRGLLPYLLGLIKAIFYYKPVHVRIEADDEIIEKDVLVCSVANGRYIGGGIPICPAASINDGLLDLVIVENVPKHRMITYLPGLMLGKILEFDITSHKLCKRVVIDSKGMKLNCDGEIVTVDHVEFNMLPGELMLYRV